MANGGRAVQDFTVVVWWDGPDSDRPTRMAAFFAHEEAVEKASGGTG